MPLDSQVAVPRPHRRAAPLACQRQLRARRAECPYARFARVRAGLSPLLNLSRAAADLARSYGAVPSVCTNTLGFASERQRGGCAVGPSARCSYSSDSAASGRARRCARTASLPRSRTLPQRSRSSSGAITWSGRRRAPALTRETQADQHIFAVLRCGSGRRIGSRSEAMTAAGGAVDQAATRTRAVR